MLLGMLFYYSFLGLNMGVQYTRLVFGLWDDAKGLMVSLGVIAALRVLSKLLSKRTISSLLPSSLTVSQARYQAYNSSTPLSTFFFQLTVLQRISQARIIDL